MRTISTIACMLLLAFYIPVAWASGEPPAPGEEAGAGLVGSKLIEGALPVDDPTSPRWEEADMLELQMSPQVHWDPRIFNTTAKSMKVRSLHDGERVAFLLEYKDPIQDPGDAVAIEFPVGDKKSHFAHAQEMFMIETGKVNIWYWKNSADGVTDMNAEGFGTTAPQAQQDVKGKGVWKDGVWRVVFSRPIKSTDTNDAELGPGKFVQIAFAAWDESNFERGAMKAVTSWWWFFAEPLPDRTPFIYIGLAVLGVAAFEAFVVKRVQRKG